MEDKKLIDVVGADGVTREAEVLLLFRLVDDGPEYIVYTFNEKDENDLVKVYSSVYKEDEEGFTLEDIETDEEWAQIKDVMRQVISENKE